MATMKAIRIHAYGGPEVNAYEDAPRPAPEDGEVLVAIAAASVNPYDWKVRAGYMQAFMPIPMPAILGVDLSGTVEAVGSAAPFAIGDAVFGRATRGGSYAEYAAVKATNLVAKPPALPHEVAATLPVAGGTAWKALEVLELARGQTILIHGAAGGVGTFAVQLAKIRGARILATGSGDSEAFLLGLGVDRFIDYRKERFEDVISGLDAVFDTVGGDNPTRSLGVLKDGGALCTIAGQAPDGGGRVRVVGVGQDTPSSILEELAALAAKGELRPVIAEVLPLSETARAHAMSQGGHVRGKIVLRPRPAPDSALF
jgi:NADPH:quinone reductase-like Zn-dependent oxidoreductase